MKTFAFPFFTAQWLKKGGRKTIGGYSCRVIRVLLVWASTFSFCFISSTSWHLVFWRKNQSGKTCWSERQLRDNPYFKNCPFHLCWILEDLVNAKKSKTVSFLRKHLALFFCQHRMFEYRLQHLFSAITQCYGYQAAPFVLTLQRRERKEEPETHVPRRTQVAYCRHKTQKHQFENLWGSAEWPACMETNTETCCSFPENLHFYRRQVNYTRLKSRLGKVFSITSCCPKMLLRLYFCDERQAACQLKTAPGAIQKQTRLFWPALLCYSIEKIRNCHNLGRSFVPSMINILSHLQWASPAISRRRRKTPLKGALTSNCDNSDVKTSISIFQIKWRHLDGQAVRKHQEWPLRNLQQLDLTERKGCLQRRNPDEKSQHVLLFALSEDSPVKIQEKKCFACWAFGARHYVLVYTFSALR